MTEKSFLAEICYNLQSESPQCGENIFLVIDEKPQKWSTVQIKNWMRTSEVRLAFFLMFDFFPNFYFDKIHITEFAILTTFKYSVGIKYIHIVLQSSPTSISITHFHLAKLKLSTH